MAKCLISLGSNLGDRAALLDAAVARLIAQKQIGKFAESRRFETTPIGGPAGQNNFLNSAARFETTLAPADLLLELQAIENDLGRTRKERWGARVVDIDLLLYDDLVLNTPTLQVPHPRMTFRRFVLEPAASIAGEMLHPTSGWTVQRLWQHLLSAEEKIIVAGIDYAQCENICRAVSERLLGTAAENTRIVASENLSHREAKLLVAIVSPGEASPAHRDGPVLNLSADDIQRAIEEIAAAALAMHK